MADGGWGGGFWSDSAWGMSSLLRDASESVTAADAAPVAVEILVPTVSESVVASDSQSSRGIFNIAVPETVTANDLISGSFVVFRSVAEVVIGSDAISVSPIYARQFSDVVTGADQVSPSGSTYRVTASDTTSGQDTASIRLVIPASALESSLAADSLGLTSTLRVNTSDTAVASDSPSAAQRFAVSLVELVSGVDSLSPGQTLFPVFSSTARAIDFTGSGAGAILFVAVEEYITGGEGLGLQNVLNSGVAESSSFTDGASARVVFVSSNADSVSASEEMAPSGSFYVIVADSAGAADSAVRRLLWELGDDAQVSGWQNITNDQSTAWQDSSNPQSPDWQPTNTLN